MTKQFSRWEKEKMLKVIQDGLDHYDSDYKDLCLRIVKNHLEENWFAEEKPSISPTSQIRDAIEDMIEAEEDSTPGNSPRPSED